jgi:hypothetical protein
MYDFSCKVKNAQMHKVSTWRELLGHIIEDPQERQRIAQELEITPITLSRWAKNDSMRPRPQNMQRLLKALPSAYREQFLELMPVELTTTVKDGALTDSVIEIPMVFYVRVLRALATIPFSFRSQAIYDLILLQALEQLDLHRLGMAIIVIRCMPPWDDGKIHSLRESIGLGTPPWGRNLEANAVFLGAESLSGHVLTSGRHLVVQNLEDGTSPFPIHVGDYEKSTAIYPILRGSMAMGCLLVSSTQYDYFTPVRLELIQNYTDLIALAFEPAEFYALESIDLRSMPSSKVQREHFATFWQRVQKTMVEAQRLKRPLNIARAEQQVWRELEAELLQLQ